MSAIADRLRVHAKETESMAEAIERLTRDRDYYKSLAVRFAELVDRQRVTYAEGVMLDEVGRVA